ncbi:MAG: thioredoxin-disulfide reductase [Firmicutes bacterium]|nr:thioredoxin-disulfide reductase [Bacillota bacterium]
MDNWDLIIIGGGPAGLTAGMYAARARLKTLLLEGGAIGGQATTTDWIENYPGFPEGVSGFELMYSFQQQAERFGLEIRYEEVQGLGLAGGVKTVSTPEGSYQAKAIVIASGARHRRLGVPGEAEFHGRGVSYCATCDGAFFLDSTVAVVGGGDAAVEEAVFLTRYASQVYLVHRRDKLRATSILQERALGNPKITPCWNSTVDEIKGENRVAALVLNDVKTRDKRELKVDGVFVYVGIDPNTAFLGDEIRRSQEGYVWVDETLQTSVPGVFAAGDVRDKDLRQVATAVGDGALVVFSVERYLTNLE